MNTAIRELWQKAVECFRAGRMQQAADICRQIVTISPKSADAWNLLGMIALALVDYETARDAFERATALDANNANYHNNLGVTYRNLGQAEQAATHFELALELSPNDVRAVLNLGNACFQMGDEAKALALYQSAIQLDPQNAAIYNNLGSYLLERGQIAEAVQSFLQATVLSPNEFRFHVNCADALTKLRKFEQALAHYTRASQLRPGAAQIHQRVVSTLNELRMHDDALDFLAHTIKVWPRMAESHIYLGDTYRHIGEYEAAMQAYAYALKLAPGSAEALNNLGNLFMEIGCCKDAVDCLRKTLSLRPNQLGVYDRLLFVLNYDPELSKKELFQAHIDSGRLYASEVPDSHEYANVPNPDRPLRVGYLSSDFRKHVVAYFIEPILRHHDRNSYRTFLYGNVRRPDEVSSRFSNLAHEWRDVYGVPDSRVVQYIHTDQIDILVDLTGRMADNRLGVFARKPAPVQVTYLGYPNTTGLTQIDYRLTDFVADPPEEDALFTEKLWRLPGHFACYLPPAAAPEVNSLPAAELGYITFGSLHNLRKLNPRVLDLWSQVLVAVPRARLLLFRDTLGELAQHRLAEQFARHGITRDRLEMRQARVHGCDHLIQYHAIDITLDSFPWNGNATACESLWMGVPVLTLVGDRHSGRMVASALTALGMNDWVAAQPRDYVDRAVCMAKNLEGLSVLRQNLRDKMESSLICDGATFTQALESTYRQMWQTWCAQITNQSA